MCKVRCKGKWCRQTLWLSVWALLAWYGFGGGDGRTPGKICPSPPKLLRQTWLNMHGQRCQFRSKYYSLRERAHKFIFQLQHVTCLLTFVCSIFAAAFSLYFQALYWKEVSIPKNSVSNFFIPKRNWQRLTVYSHLAKSRALISQSPSYVKDYSLDTFPVYIYCSTLDNSNFRCLKENFEIPENLLWEISSLGISRVDCQLKYRSGVRSDEAANGVAAKFY